MRSLLRHAAQRGIAAQLRTHPCQHLNRVEGLRDVVIRPDIQPQNLVAVLTLRSAE